ncbi:hypothetical protein ABBQ38_009941 [Trebouxia sp. C0009 RCD-2024]
MNLPPQISYHYPCPDGVFAALAAHLRFSVAAQKVIWVPNAVYAPKQVNDLQLQVSQELRRIFEYIEDADLWRWKLPDSKAFHAGLSSLNLEYDANINPKVFRQLCQLDLKQVINKGKAALQEQAQQIAAVLKTSFVVTLGGASDNQKHWGSCLAVRTDSSLAKLRSSIGNALAEASSSQGLRAIGVVAYVEDAMQNPTKIKVSLRSIGDEDTTAVSQAYGGGGHKNASSFVTDISEFESWS